MADAKIHNFVKQADGSKICSWNGCEQGTPGCRDPIATGADVLAAVAKMEAKMEAKIDQQQSTLDAVKKTADETKEAVSHKRRDVSMSGIDSDSWKEVEASGFKLVPEDWPAALTEKLTADASAAAAVGAGASADVPFEWTEANENQQAAQYTAYIRAHLSPLPANVRLMAAPAGLLSTKSPLLPFNVNGTTDLILVEQASVAAKLEASGIRAVIELKKDLAAANSRARQQAMVELIVADISSYFLPFVLLSDLKDSFLFFWLDEAKERMHERQIHYLVAPSRKLAFLLLNRLLAQCSRVEEEMRTADAYLATLGVGIHKRRKLSVVAEQHAPAPAREEREQLRNDSDSGVDGSGWDEEDIPMLLRRQVRKAMRNTPFLLPYLEPPFPHAIKHAMFT